MKYAKMLALAAVAAGALMAFIGAGTASASKLCSTTVDPCPAGQHWPVNTVLDFSIPSGFSANLVDTSGNSIDKCTTSTVKGKIDMTGSATETVTGPVEELTWGSCTFPTTTVTKGTIEVHKIAGTSNGTVTAGSEFRVTINTVLFGKCIYGVTAGADLGEITEGNPAVFDANAIAEKIKVEPEHNCPVGPSTARWTASYQLTSPSGTTLSVSSS